MGSELDMMFASNRLGAALNISDMFPLPPMPNVLVLTGATRSSFWQSQWHAKFS
jgi:hypothetical protein